MKARLTVPFYVLVVFIVSCLWQLLILLTGGVESRFFPFVMFFPGLVAVAFRLATGAGFKNVGWGLKRWWYVFPAIFIPLGFTVAIMAALVASDKATLTGFAFSDGRLVDARFTLLLGKQVQSIPFFALNLIVSYVWVCLIGSIFALGEEFGWQGYLAQKLLKQFGLNRGLILLGMIWGYWHLPLILMGYNFPNLPVLGGLVLMPMFTIFAGIISAWLYLRSRSIWMSALLHASGNAAAPLLLDGLVMHQDELLRQLLWIAGWGVAAAFCLIALNRRPPQLWQEAGESAISDLAVRSDTPLVREA